MWRDVKRQNEQKQSYGKAFPEIDGTNETYGASTVREWTKFINRSGAGWHLVSDVSQFAYRTVGNENAMSF